MSQIKYNHAEDSAPLYFVFGRASICWDVHSRATSYFKYEAYTKFIISILINF